MMKNNIGKTKLEFFESLSRGDIYKNSWTRYAYIFISFEVANKDGELQMQITRVEIYEGQAEAYKGLIETVEYGSPMQIGSETYHHHTLNDDDSCEG